MRLKLGSQQLIHSVDALICKLFVMLSLDYLQTIGRRGDNEYQLYFTFIIKGAVGFITIFSLQCNYKVFLMVASNDELSNLD